MQYLITPGLIDSWIGYINTKDDFYIDKEADFINMLDRSFMKHYFYSEYAISYINGDDSFSKEPGIKEIYGICKGGVCNVSGSSSVSIAENKYLLFLKSHVLRGPDLFRIIFDENYYIGKYFNSAYHRFGFYCFHDTEKFTYLICNGEDLFTETYNMIDTESPAQLVQNFLNWISNYPDLEEIYFNKWNVESIKKNQNEKINTLFNHVVNDRILELKKDMYHG